MSKVNLFIQVILASALAVSGQLTSSDSLVVNPAHPTTNDSIKFSIVIPNWDCCTVYYEDSSVAVVNDTELMLSYQYQQPQVCPMMACIAGSKQLFYKSAPLPAGSYAVYEAKSLKCTTSICPELALMPVRIGEITVSSSTSVQMPQRTADFRQVFPNNNDATIYTIKGERICRHSASRAPIGIFLTRIDNNRVVTSCELFGKQL